MKVFRFFVVGLCLTTAGLTPCPAMAEGPPDECPYLPAFRALRVRLPSMSADEAAGALAHYAASHENPEGCEYNEIDRLLSEQEIKLFGLTFGSKRIEPQAVYRCNQFEARTARCDSPMEDGTAHPFIAGIAPLTVVASEPFRIDSELSGAALRGFYRLSLAEALDGKAATPITQYTREVPFPHSATDMVFIAIYETHDLWRYRKIVWYFGSN